MPPPFADNLAISDESNPKLISKPISHNWIPLNIIKKEPKTPKKNIKPKIFSLEELGDAFLYGFAHDLMIVKLIQEIRKYEKIDTINLNHLWIILDQFSINKIPKTTI
mgnify:CR=1 FL=1